MLSGMCLCVRVLRLPPETCAHPHAHMTITSASAKIVSKALLISGREPPSIFFSLQITPTSDTLRLTSGFGGERRMSPCPLGNGTYFLIIPEEM